ncbi:hypothetical protein [Dyadobacter sp. CY312]|uniref:hypothetical protein n=1 Tax=Dyadobacter sp. CY312 TaxID=2907303 RepID=UPI001F3F4242|nr:hypothetical protein [Dyadobacter sp. CY312]MCE7040331.1 hypothetical protein [Dyadobacter sp. CY312]
MGYIKEPKGVDFEINGKPLTVEQKEAISDFIRIDKEKRKHLESLKSNTKPVSEPQV